MNKQIEIPNYINIHSSAKERLTECDDFLAAVQDNPKQDELRQTLERGLQLIARIAKNTGTAAELRCDLAPLSFTWCAGGFFGGLLFHGELDGFGSGAGPTFAVTLTPTEGWQIHT